MRSTSVTVAIVFVEQVTESWQNCVCNLLRRCSLIFHSFIVISIKHFSKLMVLPGKPYRCWRCHFGLRTSVVKYCNHDVTKQCVMYLQHYDIKRCVVKGMLNEDDDGNLIEKQRDKFHLKWVISTRQIMITGIKSFLQKFVWNNNLYVPQFSPERGQHFPLLFQNNYHY